MIIPDKKKTVSIILSKAMPGGEQSHMDVKPEYSNPDDDMEILHGIAEDLMHGIKIGSAHAVALALKASFNFLESKPHSENEEGEEE